MINLCQPDENKSCGACCGLYNFQDHSRQTLHALLQRRTFLFNSLYRTGDLNQYHLAVKNSIKNPPLLKDIYNCEFLGFLDGQEKRVGCLLHPALNCGQDLRQNSFYGAELCAGHFCLSYSHLTHMEKMAVREAIDDWYLYGLVITDLDFIKEFFQEVQARLGDCLRPEKLKRKPVRLALKAFFAFKENWPFAAKKIDWASIIFLKENIK